MSQSSFSRSILASFSFGFVCCAVLVELHEFGRYFGEILTILGDSKSEDVAKRNESAFPELEEDEAKNQLVEYQGPCSFAGKVWCIGLFKTGTTSCGNLLSEELGYTCKKPACGYYPYYPFYMWDEAQAKSLYTIQNFNRSDSDRNFVIKGLDETLSANDGPWLFMFDELLSRYPLSRFIYTGRDPRDLINSDIEHFWGGTAEQALKERKKKARLDLVTGQMHVLRRYTEHEHRVEKFFSHPKRKHKLLRVNFTGVTDSPRQRIENFLGCPASQETMVHKNAKKGGYRRRISDDYWNFLNTYQDYNFSNNEDVRHLKTGKSVWETWMETQYEVFDYFNSTTHS